MRDTWTEKGGRVLGSWVGAHCPRGTQWLREPCLCSGPVVTSMHRGRGLVVSLPLLWQWFRPTTTRQPQRKFVGHLSRKSKSGETVRVKTTLSQRTDDTCQPASTREGSSVDFGFRASAGLLFDFHTPRRRAHLLRNSHHWIAPARRAVRIHPPLASPGSSNATGGSSSARLRRFSGPRPRSDAPQRHR